MRATIGNRTITLMVGDLSQEATDAVVTAANRQLLGGGGVDGAIHRAAGPSVLQECKRRYPKGCPPGEAVITRAGCMQAQYIIHAVGPIWHGGGSGEADLLYHAYLKSLEIAAEHACMSIAFPAISTGAYAYPISEAAKIALRAVRDFEHESGLPEQIHFVLYSTDILKQFEAAMAQTPGLEPVAY